MTKIAVKYATSSAFKKEEMKFILENIFINVENNEKMLVGNAFDISFVNVATDEPLERDLVQMVRHKVKSAYRRLLVPCIVEHAGLIYEDFEKHSFPGGLTQPIWDALGAEAFLKSASWVRGRFLARAVVAYCDGRCIRTFVGDTWGSLSQAPRGGRGFYWDTVFCPDDGEGLTYAELADASGDLARKVQISQSTKAMLEFFKYVYRCRPTMFPDDG